MAGVLDELSNRKEVTNPNKWDKHLGPWFNCALRGNQTPTSPPATLIWQIQPTGLPRDGVICTSVQRK
jgi:hypothetical protein